MDFENDIHAAVIAILHYSCETWALTKSNNRHLEALSSVAERNPLYLLESPGDE